MNVIEISRTPTSVTLAGPTKRLTVSTFSGLWQATVHNAANAVWSRGLPRGRVAATPEVLRGHYKSGEALGLFDVAVALLRA